jgi:hypothetical protein
MSKSTSCYATQLMAPNGSNFPMAITSNKKFLPPTTFTYQSGGLPTFYVHKGSSPLTPAELNESSTPQRLNVAAPFKGVGCSSCRF